jgi:signal transduction histidine kinase
MLAGLALFSPLGDQDDTLSQLVDHRLPVLFLVLVAWAAYRQALRYVGSESSRRASAEEAARLEGVSLATSALRHHLGNKLAVAVGHSELLAEDPRLPPDLETQANKILTSAMAAAETVRKLDQQLVRVQVDSSVAGPPLLDVDASTGPLPDAPSQGS